MKFFNPKEDVLDIKLTQYGKSLLSKGLLKPEYYLFFDDDILYDANYGGVSTEKQNDADLRIQEKTPKLKSQYSFTAVSNKSVPDSPQSIVDRDFSLTKALGTSDQSSNLYPKWSMQLLNQGGQGVTIASSSNYMTSSYQTLRIPQIDINANFRTTISLAGGPTAIKEDPNLSSKTYEDGTYISVEPRTILLQVLEENSVFEKENFDIEVYVKETEHDPNVNTGGTDLDVWTPLSFRPKKSNIVNGILLDETPEECMELDPSYVEYYFDTFVDSEVDEDFVCNAIKDLKSKDIHIDESIVCPDVSDAVVADVYAKIIPDDPCPDECP